MCSGEYGGKALFVDRTQWEGTVHKQQWASSRVSIAMASLSLYFSLYLWVGGPQANVPPLHTLRSM